MARKAKILEGETTSWRRIPNGFIVSRSREVKKGDGSFDYKTVETYQEEQPDFGSEAVG